MDNKRHSLYLQAINKIYEAKSILSEYETIPKMYDDEFLYEREIHTLQCIGNNPGITTTELAEHFHFTVSACSQTVKKLKEKGLIVQQTNEDNKKKYNLFLSDHGKKLYDFHEEYDLYCYNQIYKENMGEFSEEDFETFIRIQSQINIGFRERLNQRKSDSKRYI